MKYDETTRTSADRLEEAAVLGRKLHALRMAVGITQAEAAVRAGLSRSTAVLIEAGDERRTLTQILRYLDAISPRTTLLALLTDDIGAVKNMHANAMRKRVRSNRALAKPRQPCMAKDPVATSVKPDTPTPTGKSREKYAF